MKISTRARYGTRSMLDIALHEGEGPVHLKAIAERQEISLPYLEHIVAPLIRAGLLRATRGPSGGVSLRKRPEDIPVREVIEALEGSMAPVDCVDDPSVCSRADSCVTCDVWAELKGAMVRTLESVTLKDLVERHKAKQEALGKSN